MLRIVRIPLSAVNSHYLSLPLRPARWRRWPRSAKLCVAEQLY